MTQLLRLFKLMRTRLWAILLLLLIPLLYIISALKISDFKIADPGGVYWRISGWYDPEYPYLFNSLNLAHLKTPGHTDHPGTTLQILGAIVLKISYFIESIFNPDLDGLNEAVLNNPEKYLHALNYAILLITIFLIFLVGLVSWLLFQNLSLSLILQITPFLNLANLQALNRVSPEPLLFCISQMLVILLLFYIFKQDPEKSKWFSIGLGIILGLGIATKLTFIPLITFILIIPQIRSQILALVACILTFITATSPIAVKYKTTLEWLIGFATHTGEYGRGDRGFIETTVIWKNLTSLVSLETIFFTLVIISTLVWSILFLINRQTNWNREAQGNDLEVRKLHLLLGVIILVIWLQIFLTIKQPRIHYLIPSMGLGGLLLFVQVTLVSSLIKDFRYTKAKLFAKFFPLIALTVCICTILQQLPTNFQTVASYYKIRQQENQIIENIIDEKYSNCLKVRYFGSSSIQYALTYADYYSGNNFSDRFDRLYPKDIFYSLWTRNYSSYVQPLPESYLLDRECVIFHGWIFGGPNIGKEYYPDNLILKPIYIGKYEALYETTFYNLGEDISFARQGNTSQAAIYQKSGWSQPEDWGTWTNGDIASLLVKLDRLPSSDLKLIVESNAFVAPNHPQQDVDILVNGTTVGRWTFNLEQTNPSRQVIIPASVIKEGNILEINFRLEDAKSPAELDVNQDTRKLGIAVKKLSIVPFQEKDSEQN